MKYEFQYCRSLIFFVSTYGSILVFGTLYFPLALFTSWGAQRAVNDYSAYVRWSATWMVGLRCEIRGQVPTGDVFIGSKHQSFFDVILLAHILPEPRFIMKASLARLPFLGWFANRVGSLPIEREKGREAMRKMLEADAQMADKPGQLVIYPQGTRVLPGEKRPYKGGIAALYFSRPRECVPVAVNVGLFWPRSGIYCKPGVAVLEFLPAIPTGLRGTAFMTALEEAVENGSDALMREAGFALDHDEKRA